MKNSLLCLLLFCFLLSGCSCRKWFQRNPNYPCSERTKKLLTFWPELRAPHKPKAIVPKEMRKRYRLTKVLVEDIDLVSKNYASYQGIYEALTGKEAKGGRVFVRLDPTRRSGLYFVVKFNNALSMIPAGSKITITFLGSDSPIEHVRTWYMPAVKHRLHWQNELWLQVTIEGSDDILSKEAQEELKKSEAKRKEDFEEKVRNVWDVKKQKELTLEPVDKKAQRKVSSSLIAWKIEIWAPDGKLLEEKTSYAW